MTQMVEVVPLIYGMLLHTGVFAKGSPAPSPAGQFAKHTLDVAEVCLGLLNHVALVDLHMLQVRSCLDGVAASDSRRDTS